MSSYKLTSTRKNEDVISILDEVNRKEGIKVTDYICNAIRFFEKYKNIDIDKINKFYEKNKDFNFENNNINYVIIQEMIDSAINKKISEIEKNLVNNNKDEVTITSDKDLENIDDDFINIDED